MQNYEKQFEFLKNYIQQEIKKADKEIAGAVTDNARMYAKGKKESCETVQAILSDAETFILFADTLAEAVNDFTHEDEARLNELEQRAKEKKPTFEDKINVAQNQEVRK